MVDIGNQRSPDTFSSSDYESGSSNPSSLPIPIDLRSSPYCTLDNREPAAQKQCILPLQYESPHPQISGTFPLEIGLVMIDVLLAEAQKAWCERDDWVYASLKSLSLVCHDWYKRCTPVLYSGLHIDVGYAKGKRIEDLVGYLQEPNHSFKLHTVRLVIWANNTSINRLFAPGLSKLLPNVRTLMCNDVNWQDQPLSPPHWSEQLALSWAGFASLERLELRQCKFNSSSDIIRLVSALPALLCVQLSEVKWNRTAQVVGRRNNHLSCILTRYDNPRRGTYLLWLLALPERPNGAIGHTFPGLLPTEVLIITSICHNIINSRGRLDMELTKSLYPKTWVITLHDRRDRWIEVHIASSDGANSIGYVRWVVFRFCSYHEAAWEHVGKRLAQLLNLEKIMWEPYKRDDDNTLEPLPPTMLGMMSNKIHIWTRKGSKEYALKAREEGARFEKQFPISPYHLLRDQLRHF